MRIGVLGTGQVGQTMGRKLVEIGHDVCLGSRTPDNDKGVAWARETGGRQGTFAVAAGHGEVVFNCVSGMHSLAALQAAGAEALANKVLLDLANPLDFSQGFPPRLSVCNDDSLAEQIQRTFPNTRVVKTLNTMSHPIMVDPTRVPGAHDVFVSSDDPGAKETAVALLGELGWTAPIDLGPLSTARGTEAWLLLWTRMYAAFGSGDFQLKIVRP